MKELTVEEKAKRYDEAIELAKEINNEQRAQPFNVMTKVFPELEGSDDEKIRKKLLSSFKCIMADADKDELWYGLPYNDIITWLEKQGEDKKEINSFEVLPGLYKCVHRMFDGTPETRLLFEVGNVYKCLSKHDRAEFEVSYGHYIYLEDPVVCKHFIPFKSKGGQKPTEEYNITGIKSKHAEGKLGEMIKEMESTDKVEPKFHEGDWVLNNVCFPVQIASIEGGMYVFTEGDALSVSFVDENYHLWSIQDAEEGDVLATDGGVCIFDGTLEEGKYPFAYCGITKRGFESYNGNIPFSHDNNIHPATKEQRDTLMKAMTDAGYTFDFEKKELKLLITNGGYFESENCEQNHKEM